MVAFYLILLGVYFHYSRSKYCPSYLIKIPVKSARIAGNVLLLAGTVRFVYHEEWASGLLLSLVACGLAMTLIPFTAVLGKRYFIILTVLVHILLVADIFTYAS
ncbi:hypothetical protein [Dyadobacter sp. Leaf189]|uniref:hypothetical protein n=1 Tax=Dyadobacter sp. Leaf189 TaxID=1736295 RepID=UPI0006F3E767|nr:hypothetical protein [Dyadobacter sp. Leaf189]KQS33456.1 hypothetical protein ASG33_05110 [Dyadobacter sp. Leaf189]